MPGGNVYLMVLNQDREDAVTGTVQLSNDRMTDPATVWTLSGSGYLPGNTLANPNNVSIDELPYQAVPDSFEHTFPSHYIMAIKLTGIVTPGRGVIRFAYRPLGIA